MPETRLTGSRIRERRLAQGVRQADLARDVGISPAYLNLIERNQRPLTAGESGASCSSISRAISTSNRRNCRRALGRRW